jgi:hypothetical protein
MTVLVAAISTSGSAVVLVAAQVITWLQNGRWEAYPLSSFVLGRHDITGTVAREPITDRINVNRILDWVLGVPAVVPLLIAIVALIALWRYLSEIERTGFTR